MAAYSWITSGLRARIRVGRLRSVLVGALVSLHFILEFEI